MKKFKILIIGILLPYTFAVAQAQINISGSWKRNNELSDAGDLSLNTIPVAITIKQDELLIVEMTFKNGKGEISNSSDTLKVNGQPKTLINAQTKNQHVSSAQWSDSKAHLLFKQSTLDPAGKVLQEWAHDASLTADGRLEIDLKLTDESNEYFLKEVFDKN